MQVCHGDIKSENVMVTGWIWVLLTDFASYKPTYLPAVSTQTVSADGDTPFHSFHLRGLFFRRAVHIHKNIQYQNIYNIIQHNNDNINIYKTNITYTKKTYEIFKEDRDYSYRIDLDCYNRRPFNALPWMDVTYISPRKSKSP